MDKAKHAGGVEAPKAPRLAGLKSLIRRLEFKRRGEEITAQALEVEQKMSIRAKISVSLLVVILLVLPVVGMTLHYFGQMRKKVDTIALTDAKLIDLGSRIDEGMLLAKRAESNFILLRDSLYVDRNQRATKNILGFCAEGKEIAIGEQASFQDISEQAKRYQDAFAVLVGNYRGTGVQDQISALRRGFSAKFTETITRYNLMAAAARKESVEARRDSLINEANGYLRSFSIDDLTVGLQSKQDPQMTALSQILGETSENVRNLANELEQRNWRQLEQHRQESEMVVARAQRNISVVLIMTIMVSAYMLFVLPARLVKPISAITSIIRRAEQGDFEATATSASDDEVGQLALFLNRMLRQVRIHDSLKTEKISTQQQKVEALADVMTEGVMILNQEREITLVNRALRQRLGWQNEALDKPLGAVDTKGELSALVREALDKGDDVESKQVLLDGADGNVVTSMAKIHLLRTGQGAVFAILIIAL
ncbi:MAG: HAMP domain-containing protein [Candidatus Latescibacterota bacterium]